MSDAINEGEIQKRLPNRIADEKGISKLERWLRQEGYPQVDRDVKFLRNLQELRSKATAHLKGSGYEKALSKILGDLRGPAAVASLLDSALQMLNDLQN